jgi:hypothetical protein
MKKIFKYFLFFPAIAFAQTYTVTQQPNYGLDPRYNSTTYIVKENNSYSGAYSNPQMYDRSIDASNQQRQAYQNMFDKITNSTNQAIQAQAQRAAYQAVINNQNRLENERLEREYQEKLRLQEIEKKRLQKEKRIEEEKNPNSILNKFKNAKIN